MSTKIKAVVNRKGGAGKTTTAVSLCACFAEAGKRGLLIDLDSQGHASKSLGLRVAEGRSGLYRVLVDGDPIVKHVVDTGHGFDLITSSKDAAEVEIRMTMQSAGRLQLREALAEIPPGRWDYVLIDCPPALGHLTQSALIACDGVIVPLPMEALPFDGFQELLDTISSVRRHDNRTLTIQAIFETMSDPRTTLATVTRGQLESVLGTNNPIAATEALLELRVRRSIALAEAPDTSKPVTAHKPSSKGTADYRALACALTERGIV
jgi:chromosome partitioning protein